MNRIKEIDILKGILIILVVIGHTSEFPFPSLIKYIYLFHMPAFFLTSGMLYKYIDKKNVINFFKKITFKYLVPYFCFLVLIGIYSNYYFYGTPIIKFVIAGRSLTGLMGIFWFINCLWFTIIIFTVINTYIKINLNKYLLIAFIYSIGVIMTKYFTHNMIIPWNLDVCFISLLYFSIGYYLKDILVKSKKLIVISAVSVTIISMLLWLNQTNILFNMKSALLFSNPILQIIFPVGMTVLLLFISRQILNMKLVSDLIINIGSRSLAIMYLHLPIHYTLIKLGSSNVFLNIIIVLALSTTISYFILERNRYLSLMLLGKKNNEKNKIRGGIYE